MKIARAGRRPRRRWPLAPRLLAGLFALLTVLVCLAGLLAARLAVGPISLDWLVPFVQSALSKHDGDVRIQLREAALTWRGWAEGPTLSLGGVRAVSTEGRFDAAIDAMSASLSAQSVLAGQPVPSRLSARGIRATVVLPAPSATTSEGAGLPSLDRLFVAGPLRFVDAIAIDDVAVALAAAPGRVVWQGRIQHMAILRGPAGLEGQADLSMDQDGAPGTATLAVRSDATTQITTATLAFTDLRLPALAPLADELAPLSIVDLPLSGTVAALLGANGTLQTLSLSAIGKNGLFDLPPTLADRFGLTGAAQTVVVRSLELQVSGQPATGDWTLEALRVQLPDTERLALPAPIGKTIPLRRITGRATLHDGRLNVPALDITLDRPLISVTADVADVAAVPRGTVQVTIRDATVLDVRAYWPPQMAANAFNWVNTHLTAGTIPEAVMQMTLGAANGAATVTALQLTIPLEGAVVDYLQPLPPVRDGRVVVALDLKTLAVSIQQARVDGLAVSDGRVVIPDFNVDTPTIDIDFVTRGGLADLVALLATKPLEFVPTDLIRPENFGGRFDARVRLGFPLVEDLDTEQIDVTVGAATTGASFTLPTKGIAISEGDLRFSVTDTGLHAAGPVRIDGVRGILDWGEDFLAATPLRRTVSFHIGSAAVAGVRDSLAPMVSLAPYLLGGRFAGVLQYTERDDSDARLDARLELTEAELAIPELRWRKPVGQAASVHADVSLVGGRLDAIRSFRLVGGDADVHGSALFTDAGDLHSIHLDPFVLGRSHLKATVISMDGKGWDVTLTGSSLDVAPFLQDTGEAGQQKDVGSGPDLRVAADLGRVWIDSASPLQSVLVSVKRTGGAWQSIQIRGQTEAGAPFGVEMQPLEGNISSINVFAQDAGATLSSLGLSTNLRGGRLTGLGAGVLSPDGFRLSGEVRVDRFHLINAPLIARMLDILAVTGLRDVLGGRGIAFTSMRIPFEMHQGVLELRNARASGPSLGMTGSGSIDFDNDTIFMNGTVIPFFWANSALGRLPLIGGWLTGGEDGGGLFSATYRLRGSLDDPQLDVNPYSIILPSVIRAILEWIQGWIGPPGNGQLTNSAASP